MTQAKPVDQDTRSRPRVVLLATDRSQSIIGEIVDGQTQTIGYSAYGEQSAPQKVETRLGFNGQEREADIGWYLLGNGYRAYNPRLMRFHSPDSWSPFRVGGSNAYMYCVGDPVNRTDSTGHFFSSLAYEVKKFFSNVDTSLLGGPEVPDSGGTSSLPIHNIQATQSSRSGYTADPALRGLNHRSSHSTPLSSSSGASRGLPTVNDPQPIYGEATTPTPLWSSDTFARSQQLPSHAIYMAEALPRRSHFPSTPSTRQAIPPGNFGVNIAAIRAQATQARPTVGLLDAAQILRGGL